MSVLLLGTHSLCSFPKCTVHTVQSGSDRDHRSQKRRPNRPVAGGRYLRNQQSIVAEGADIYVTEVATADGNFGVGRVIHVDSRTGAQKVVSEGGYLVGPVGIAVDASGQIVVGDPYTINPESPDLYDGGIIRIDPLTGSQTLIARGHGSFVNPRGLAIVQSGAPHQIQVTGKSWRRK